jgi:hypothetical protein
LLILIDGKKTLAELTTVLTIGSESHERIKALFDAGLIAEVLQHPTKTAQNPVNQHIAAEPNNNLASSDKNLQTAIRTATRLLADMLGPNSDILCIQLEKCKTKDEFNAKILECRKVVGAMRTEKLGDEFVKAAIF